MALSNTKPQVSIILKSETNKSFIGDKVNRNLQNNFGVALYREKVKGMDN